MSIAEQARNGRVDAAPAAVADPERADPERADPARADPEPPEQGAEEQGAAGRARSAGWLRELRVPLALALALALAGGGLMARTAQLRDEPAAANRALVDAAATAQVIGDVSNALTAIFSYSYADTATTEQAARNVLANPAYGQYQALFGQVKQQAAAQRLTLTTRVVRAGVVRLTDDSAELLVFLDQQAARDGRPSGGVVAAQLSLTVRRSDGHWRIVNIRSS